MHFGKEDSGSVLAMDRREEPYFTTVELRGAAQR